MPRLSAEDVQPYLLYAPTGDPARKLSAIRRAVRHEFPTGDIDAMLADIERG